MSVVSVVGKLNTIEQRPNQSCLFRLGDYRNKGYGPGNLSFVRATVMIYVARKLNTIEERRKVQYYIICFGEDFHEQGPQLRKTILGSIHGEYDLCSLKIDVIKEHF